MDRESEQTSQNDTESSMSRHKPASSTTQDISHLLASIFQDLYTTEVIGKNTVASLTKSRRGDNNCHDKYVEELQQVHLKYNRRIRDADMLENHIIQARLQADTREHYVQAQAQEVGEGYHHLGLPPVKSPFPWCVDSTLLKSNNLICPQDYITELVPLINSPQGKSSPGYARPTISYQKHVCTQPQDDGYSLILHSEHTAQSLLEESEETCTLHSSQEASSTKGSPAKAQLRRRPSQTEKLSSRDQAEVWTALRKVRERQNFLRSPHFQPLSGQRGGSTLIIPERREKGAAKGRKASSSLEAPVPVFIASPPVVMFTDYQVGQVYETTVELRNTTAASRRIRVIPPTTPHFSVGLGRFPGEGATVAPGLSCQYTVRFAPDSLADYEDFLVVETQSPYPLIVPVEAHIPPPMLTLPPVLDCGYCLVGGVKFMELECRNEGQSAGMFCIMPKNQWPASSLRSAVKAVFAEQAPFAIGPSLFALLPGQTAVMEVFFLPTAAESYAHSFTIVCDNCQVKDFTIQGVGQQVELELVEVEGEENPPALEELRDLSADHFVRFDAANPHSKLQKRVLIKNKTYLELPFHWQIVKPSLQSLLPGEAPVISCIQHHVATDNAFSISPVMGLLTPEQVQEFQLSYHPQELLDYHSVCQLVIMEVPDLLKTSDDGEIQQLDMLSRMSDVVVMEMDLKGSTLPYKILLEPYALLIPGETYIHTTIRKPFKMWNHSKSPIRFDWERVTDCHVIEVEPSSGEIEVFECVGVVLVLRGCQPGCLSTTLLCHIQHHPTPVRLAIEATFKGPHLSLSMPSVDLGLLELGQDVSSTLQISNTSPVEACWCLQEVSEDTARQGQVRVEPRQGVLAPLASCSVDVLFQAVCCQSFETVLELSVLDGTGCHLSLQADVQSPQVCLLNCKLELPNLYVGVAQRASTTLFNQTLLPALFTWTKLQGPHAHLYSASFTPPSGTLGPNTQMEISISFTAHTDEALSDVVALCEVEGMERPLVLGFCARAKHLSVSYSLPDTHCAGSGGTNQQPVLLDFTGPEAVLIGQSASRQLVITNHTAIPAPFAMEAKVFNGHCPLQSVKSSRHRRAAVRMPLHAMQAKKIQDAEYEGFVSGLLTHGKGAAFLAEPHTGMLGPFETETISITAFNNMWGNYQDHLICKVGDLDPTLIPMRLSVRGCPIYFQMIGQQPYNQNQGPIIRFGSHVSGGDTVSRPLRLNNISPYDIRIDWLTHNKETADRKLIDLMVSYGEPFPLRDTDGNEVVRGLGSSAALAPTQHRCHTPSTAGSGSSLKTKSRGSDHEEMHCYEQERDALVSWAPARKLLSVCIQPHEGTVADYPYCITPQQIVVPAGGSSTIHVSFTPITLLDPTSEHTCVGYAFGFMSLDSKAAEELLGNVSRAQGHELEPLRLDLQAHVKPATVTVQMGEDEEVLQFFAAASDLLDGDTLRQECILERTLQLGNGTDMPLSIRLLVQPPFSVMLPSQDNAHTASSSPRFHPHRPPGSAERPATLLLQPKRNMRVKVAFHLSASILTYQNRPLEEVPPSVTLLCSEERGGGRMCFEQSLTIQYSNNTAQTVPMAAYLGLPMLHLSCGSVDFGTCYVGQTRVREVYLSNQGSSGSAWTALIDAGEGSDAFRVTPQRGTLTSPEYSYSACRQALEISFTASAQRAFQATVIVQGILGESRLNLHVQGMGSFDERYALLTPDS
ncbi:deleted in lung and esophageal cancer protein 1 isoform X2 [Electrophorus electricus]|uniref:deleted in lung and esophageal cancer protein 1 isoform X2 n=1 Tax=Electrophorus electricus TaxID=8005 RepID=UPI0015D01214|nr:deleted in lung and esophageal cancer protein 1 isoform X2 [Electrophorus electricus]